MADTYRNFDEEVPVQEVEQLTFRLGGRDFTTLKYLHASVFLETSRGTQGAVAVLRRTLNAESRQNLTELLEDPDAPISDDQLDAAAAWVLRHLSGVGDRPTQPSSPSGDGDGVAGNTSKENSPSLAETSTG